MIFPKEGDDCFTLLDLYITDNYPKLELKKEVKDILFEGMISHDYGKWHGIPPFWYFYLLKLQIDL